MTPNRRFSVSSGSPLYLGQDIREFTARRVLDFLLPFQLSIANVPRNDLFGLVKLNFEGTVFDLGYTDDIALLG